MVKNSEKTLETVELDTISLEKKLRTLRDDNDSLNFKIKEMETKVLGDITENSLYMEKLLEDKKIAEESLDLKIFELESKLKAIEDERSSLRLKRSNLFDKMRYSLQNTIDSVIKPNI